MMWPTWLPRPWWHSAPAAPAPAPQPLAPKPTPRDRFADCLPIILAAEGGFVNDPRDPGGATNLGITYRTLSAFRHAPVTVDDVRALSRAEAGEIYRANYWNKLRCDELPPGVDLMVFDFGVNAGPARSARMLQIALGQLGDGVMTAVTTAAARSHNAGDLIRALAEARSNYYRSLPTFVAFGRGWLSRTATVKTKALEMAEGVRV